MTLEIESSLDALQTHLAQYTCVSNQLGGVSPQQYCLQTQHISATALLQYCAYADKMTHEALSVLIVGCVLQLSSGLQVP